MVGDIYHVCNRGIRKEKIFDTESDYFRFVLNLYRLNNKGESLRINPSRKSIDSYPEQDKIVEILKWTLLPNHYHLLLYEKVDGGVLEFVKRFGNSFTKYINIKREKSGYLFQNHAQIIQIKNDGHFLYIPFYIDLNLLDLIYPKNENRKIDIKKSLDFLKTTNGQVSVIILVTKILRFQRLSTKIYFIRLLMLTMRLTRKNFVNFKRG